MNTQRRIKRSRSRKIRRSRRSIRRRSRRTKRGGRKKRNSRKRRVSRKKGGLFGLKKNLAGLDLTGNRDEDLSILHADLEKKLSQGVVQWYDLKHIAKKALGAVGGRFPDDAVKTAFDKEWKALEKIQHVTSDTTPDDLPQIQPSYAKGIINEFYAAGKKR